MMKKNKYYYSDISSFEDLKHEKERLHLKRQLIETKLNVDYLHVQNMLSVSAMISSFSKDYLLPKLTEVLGILVSRIQPKDLPEEE